MNKFKLGDVCSIIKGTIGIQKAIAGEYPLVVTAETRSTCNEYQFDCRAVCIPLVSSTGHGHASLKRIHYQEGKFALGNILAAVIPNDENQINAEYLYHYLTFYKDEKIVTLMKGAANVSLTINSIKTIEVDIPDLQIQLRVVNSIKNIKAINNSLDEKITKQEANIKQLRQSILQEAIQGKIVEQDPNDEPASKLLKKLSCNPIYIDNLFNLPQNWAWCRLKDIANINGGFAFKSSNYCDKGIRIIRISDFDELGFKNDRIVRYKYVETLSDYILEQYNILLAMTGGTVGKSYYIKELYEPMVVNQRVATIKITPLLESQFINYVILSPIIQSIIQESKNSTNDNISMSTIKDFSIPIPPLEEQKRIVAKVDELMKNCDELEEKINKSKQYSGQLLQSILKEAFNPKMQSDSNSSVISLNSIIEKRVLADAEIKTQLHNQKNFGATKNEKLLYLFEKHQGVELGGKYAKWAAGPYDYESRHKVDSILIDKKWFNIIKANNDNNGRVTCEPAENHEEYKTAFDLAFTDEEKSKLQEIIEIFRNKTTKECEAIATLYAVWNDFLIDNKSFGDDDIVNEFRNNWDESKKDFNPSDLRDYLLWMRSKGLIPTGQGVKTTETRECNLI